MHPTCMYCDERAEVSIEVGPPGVRLEICFDHAGHIGAALAVEVSRAGQKYMQKFEELASDEEPPDVGSTAEEKP